MSSKNYKSKRKGTMCNTEPNKLKKLLYFSMLNAVTFILNNYTLIRFNE